MLWAVPAPDLTQLSVDLQPVAAVVESADSTTAAGRLKEGADELAIACLDLRRWLAADMRAALAMVARADFEGWEMNLDAPIKALEEGAAKLKGPQDTFKKTLHSFMMRVHAARVPGANTLHNSEKKIIDSLNDVMNDIDDYLSDFRDIQKRTKTYRNSPSLITRAENAYKRAFKKVLSLEEGIISERDEIDGMMTLRMLVQVPPDLLSDAEALIEKERLVHDEVALEDNILVGRVAIDYVSMR
jgi:hypothetical protein